MSTTYPDYAECSVCSAPIDLDIDGDHIQCVGSLDWFCPDCRPAHVSGCGACAYEIREAQ